MKILMKIVVFPMLSTRWLDFTLIAFVILCLPLMFHLDVMITLNVSFSDILMVLVMFWLITHQENREYLAIVLRRYYLIILYMLLFIYFCIVSMVNYVTNIFIDFPYGISAILKLSVNFIYVVVFLIFFEKYKEELLLLLLRWWKIAALIISFLCIGSVILYQMGIDNAYNLQGRAQATLNDPNLAALYLIISLSLITVLRILSGKKVIINLPVLIILLALTFTASRGGILSLVMSVAIVLFLSFLSARIKELILFLGIASFVFFTILWINQSTDVLNFALERLVNIGTEGDGTSYRLFLWKSAFDMWTKNPFIGVGIGQFIPYSTEMYGNTFYNIPHNTYLSFLTETGAFGLMAFMWFPVFILFRLISGLVIRGEKTYFYLLIGLIALSIQALTINIENIRFVWLFLMIIFVMMKGFHANQEEPLVKTEQ